MWSWKSWFSPFERESIINEGLLWFVQKAGMWNELDTLLEGYKEIDKCGGCRLWTFCTAKFKQRIPNAFKDHHYFYYTENNNNNN